MVLILQIEQEETDVHLLELDESQQSERTVFVSPPEQSSINHNFSNKVSSDVTF